MAAGWGSWGTSREAAAVFSQRAATFFPPLRNPTSRSLTPRTDADPQLRLRLRYYTVLNFCSPCVCRCSSRRFSSTSSRLPPAPTTTSGWSFKRSPEYVQVGYFPAEKTRMPLQRIKAFLPKRHFGFTPTWSFPDKHIASLLYVPICGSAKTNIPQRFLLMSPALCGVSRQMPRAWWTSTWTTTVTWMLRIYLSGWSTTFRKLHRVAGATSSALLPFRWNFSFHPLLAGVMFVTSFKGPERRRTHGCKNGPKTDLFFFFPAIIWNYYLLIWKGKF